MASAAGSFDMAADQAELGARVIKFGRGFPTRAVMATVAALVERATVLVVLAMTADAAARRTFVLAFNSMTAGAFGVAMFAQQRITGFAVVETRGFPVTFDVTLGAVIAHSAAVWIVCLMTAQAVLSQAFGDRTFNVAILALHLLVRAEQLERRARVVKLGDAQPIIRHMTFAALLAQPRLMAIILAVTIHAGTGSFAMFFAGGVAATALSTDMFTGQTKIGLGMIKGGFIESDDVRIDAQMLGVARFAASFRLAPM